MGLQIPRDTLNCRALGEWSETLKDRTISNNMLSAGAIDEIERRKGRSCRDCRGFDHALE